MSCILTSHKQINSIVEHIKMLMLGENNGILKDMEEFRIKMYSVNFRAYLERYSHRKDQFDFAYDLDNVEAVHLTSMAFIKLCKSYLYQVSDLSDCSDKKLVVSVLKKSMQRSVETNQDYEQASWTI